MKFCGNCGNQMGEGAMFCGNCGQKAGTASAPPPTPIPPTPPTPGGAYGNVSPKSKIVMIVLTLVGFSVGLQHFYAGNNKKGVLYLLVFWPCNFIGWFLFVMLIGILPLLVSLSLLAWAIVDLAKIFQGRYLDGDGLPIVN